MKRIISVLVITAALICGVDVFSQPALAKSSGKVSLKAVCSGYANAYKDLCGSVGLQCVFKFKQNESCHEPF